VLAIGEEEGLGEALQLLELSPHRLEPGDQPVGVTAVWRSYPASQVASIVPAVSQDAQREFWNVMISPMGAANDAVVVDKDREWVERRVLHPRRQGEPIAIDGQTLTWDEIDRVRITVSVIPSAQAIAQLKASDRASSVAVLGGPDYKWRAAYYAQNVTDDLIEGPPGTSAETGRAPARVDPRRVMVVYGRDGEARRAMFDYLRALNLQPGEWGQLIAETEKASPYIGEVLERAFERAAAVVVLFTPDDEAKLRDDLIKPNDPEYERKLTPQARPNVLFEAGMAFGVHPDRTVLVEVGTLRPFSDVFGRHVVRLDGTDGPLRDIARRLKTAGCEVNDGGEDWADPARFPDR
jgi:Predicted nucleotide-binding protein containing TIR-like domain